MKYDQAKQIADKVMRSLEPFCDRIAIAGSLRRKKDEVGDIEIVCIPKTESYKMDMFDEGTRRMQAFCDIIDSWHKIRGKSDGKAMNRMLPEGIQLDLFTATPQNWGYIFALRTGSARFSKDVLANGWVAKGIHGIEGNLFRGKNLIPVPEEKDLFNLIGRPMVDPQFRE
jgi:DNA polymerase/3'-5' exonuclease PolX